MESVSSSCSDQNTCMICLNPLLVPNAQPRDDDSDDSTAFQDEIGSVYPCGHVFHLKCFHKWTEHEEKQRCPNCNQDAHLFCKLFLSAPPPPPPPAEPFASQPPLPPPPPMEFITTVATDCSTAEEENPGEAVADEDEREQRQILLDLRTATQAGPAQTIRKVVSLRSKARKLRRESRETKSELESTRLVLEFTQEELQLTQQELQQEKVQVEEYKGKLARIESQHWKRHQFLKNELQYEHNCQLLDLRKQLRDAKAELALRNRQLKHWAGRSGSNPHQSVAVAEDPAFDIVVQADELLTIAEGKPMS